MSTPSLLIETVSDTALAVAYARAVETDRPDAWFQDSYARALAGDRGKQIYQKLQGDRSIYWLIVSRTWVLDNLIQQAVAQGVDTVLNLAAGLDTRPYRMMLPANLRWVEADLPGILAYKQEKLASTQPVCQLERVPVDLTIAHQRQSLFAQVGQTARNAMVITEGLLVYLKPEQVGAIATDLYHHPSITCWLTDLVPPLAVKIAQLRMSQERVGRNVQLRFAPNDADAFFHPYGWQIGQHHSLWQTAHDLKRGWLLGQFLSWFPPFNLSIARLERLSP